MTDFLRLQVKQRFPFLQGLDDALFRIRLLMAHLFELIFYRLVFDSSRFCFNGLLFYLHFIKLHIFSTLPLDILDSIDVCLSYLIIAFVVKLF